jgi:hypothetical protein
MDQVPPVPTFPPDQLVGFARALFVAAGVSAGEADVVARRTARFYHRAGPGPTRGPASARLADLAARLGVKTT